MDELNESDKVTLYILKTDVARAQEACERKRKEVIAK